MDDFYTLAEVSRRIKVPRNTLYGWIADGRLRATKPGKSYLLRWSDVEACLDAFANVPRDVA